VSRSVPDDALVDLRAALSTAVDRLVRWCLSGRDRLTTSEIIERYSSVSMEFDRLLVPAVADSACHGRQHPSWRSGLQAWKRVVCRGFVAERSRVGGQGCRGEVADVARASGKELLVALECTRPFAPVVPTRALRGAAIADDVGPVDAGSSTHWP